MDNPSTYLPIARVVELTGVPAQTLEAWIAAGKVSTLTGKRARLVRVGDVRGCLTSSGPPQNTAQPWRGGKFDEAVLSASYQKGEETPSTESRGLTQLVERALDAPDDGVITLLNELVQELDRRRGGELGAASEQVALLRRQLSEREMLLEKLSRRVAVVEDERVGLLERLLGRLRRVGAFALVCGAATRAHLGHGLSAGNRGIRRGAGQSRSLVRSRRPRSALLATLVVVSLGGLFILSPARPHTESSRIQVLLPSAAGKSAPVETPAPTVQAQATAEPAAPAEAPPPTPEADQSSADVAPAPATQAQTPEPATPTPKPAAPWRPTHQVADWGTSIRFRSGPATSFPSRVSLEPQTPLLYLQEQQTTDGVTWMHFQLQDGTDGWLRSIDVVSRAVSTNSVAQPTV